MVLVQKFDNRRKRWVKYNQSSTGKLRIRDVKQRNPRKKFVGVRVMRR